MEPIRGLTIIQPWASLIASGQKDIETRTYRTNYRGWLLIHAGKRWGTREMMICTGLSVAGASIPEPVLGAVVAVARLARCEPFLDTPREIRRATSRLVRAQGGGSPEDLDAPLHAGFDFCGFHGRTRRPVTGLWSWHLEEVVALPHPVGWTGAQGLWIPRGMGVAGVVGQLHRLGHPAAPAFGLPLPNK